VFHGDELLFLDSLGELLEIPPGIDAVPLGAGFIVAFVVVPAFLGCNVENDVLFVVLRGFGFCVLQLTLVDDTTWLSTSEDFNGPFGPALC
jgi:hypothetical protein